MMHPITRWQTRSKPVLFGCLVAAALAAPAGADVPRVIGKFAFSTDVEPGKTSCGRLTQATASRFTSCERVPLEVGKPALACSRSGGRGRYLVFDTKAACESERKGQENNE